MEPDDQTASEAGAAGPARLHPRPAVQTSQDAECTGEHAAEAAAGAGSEAEADESDRAMQSTFESRPSKSVADFPASGSVSPSTSAATSELEAKLRQRMLKCEGTDVIHRLTSPVAKASTEVGNPGKADELVRTAAYQRCTKARQESAGGPPPRVGSPPGDGSEGAEEADSEAAPEEPAREAAPEEPGPAPAPAPAAPEELPAPHPDEDRGGAASGGGSDFGSVASQEEFFEPAEGAPTTCATFALDDPTRDAAEEQSGDTPRGWSPNLLDLEDAAGADGAPSADLSVEECLLDLVNHIPPKMSQRIGTLFQHFEAAKREGASDAAAQASWPHADCVAYERQVEEHERASLLRQEQLEWQLREQAVEHSSEARALREELEESRQRSSQLQQLSSSASAEAELRETAGGELETMCAALADADSKLIDVGVHLEVTSQQSDRFRGKAFSAQVELKMLRLHVEEASARLHESEGERDQIRAEAKDMEKTERSLRSELDREAQAREEAEARLDLALRGGSKLSEEMASARAQLELWSGERAEAQARLLSSQRVQEELDGELARGRELQGQLRDEAAAACARTAEAREGLRRQAAEAEAAARSLGPELEQALAEVRALQAPAAEAALLRREVAAEGALAERLRREARAEERSLREEIESSGEAMEQLRRQMGAADSAHGSRHAGVLAAELAAATAEKDEACRVLRREREQLVKQRWRSLALGRENDELRSGQEELRARLEVPAQDMARFAEQGAGAWELRQAELEERRAGGLAEAEELRVERARVDAFEEEQSSMAALVKDLVQRASDVDVALHQARRQELLTSEELKSACSERSALEEDLSSERTKMSEERRLRGLAETEAMSLAADKELIGRRLKSALAEADRGRRHEAYMGCELTTLRRALLAESEEIKAETARRRSCRAESRQLQAASLELQSRLKAEESAAPPEAARLAQPQPGRHGAHVLRDELHLESEHLAEQSRRAAQFQRPGGGPAGPEAPRDGRSLQDSLRLQLSWTAEQRKSGLENRTPALSEELREVEEEGKVRREQLEAETSLMAMEVVTLTKGLGGRLLDTGIVGLHRNPLTVHDMRFRLGAVSHGASRAPPGSACGPNKGPPGGAAAGIRLHGARSAA